MKLKFPITPGAAATGKHSPVLTPHSALRIPHSEFRTPHSLRAFTMVEIALALAIIGFALVAIIGILPAGLSVQKDNREQTVINMDAAYLMDAIRGGARGQDDLTNFIISITNQYVFYPLAGGNANPTTNTLIFTRTRTTINNGGATTIFPTMLTNGANIIGLLSAPKYYPEPTANPPGYYSNIISAEFRAINGPALDQGASPASQDFAFHYRVTVEIVPVSDYPYAVTNTANWINVSAPRWITNLDVAANATVNSQTAKNLQFNLYQIRLNYRWPILANGQVGGGHQVYRSSAGSELNQTNFVGALFWWFNPLNYKPQ